MEINQDQNQVYNISNLFDDIETKSKTRKIPVGIFDDATYEGAVKGENFIDFNYSRKDGDTVQEHNQRIWFPPTDDSRLYPRKVTNRETGESRDETIKEARLRDFKERVSHVLLHIQELCGSSVADTLNFTSFEGLADKAVTLTNPKKGTKIALKTVPDKNMQYSTFQKILFLRKNKDNKIEYSNKYISKLDDQGNHDLYYSTWEQENLMDKYEKAQAADSNANLSATEKLDSLDNIFG